MEILGRFPTTDECKDLGLQEAVPLWLPTNDNNINRKVTKALKSLAKWLIDDYVSK